MTKALVFSLQAAHRFSAGISLPSNWHESFDIGAEDPSVFTIKYDEVAYTFRSDETVPKASIIIQTDVGKLFSCFHDSDSRLEALRRCVQAGIHALEDGGQLPDYWRPYSVGTFITFQAQPLSKSDQRRIAMLRRGKAPNGCAYIFDITSTQRDYDELHPDLNFLEKVLEGRSRALAMRPRVKAATPDLGPATHNLEELPEQVDTVVHGWKLPYLYESKLTKRQRAFVDVEMDGPVRLKGAAGTGKSLAMVAKLLREASLRKASEKPYRFLYLTHNTSAAELATDYAMALDVDEVIYSSEEDSLIRIDTLLGLALRDLSDDLGDLRPISNDANEGKRLQLIILSDTVAKFRSGDWITHKKYSSESVRAGIEAVDGSELHEQFCWDVMNEIACVLDADGIRDNQAKRDAYAKDGRRPQYLMRLDTPYDREIILAIYDLYRAALRHEGLIAVDQLIADYLGYLDSFRWDARRKKLGYDAIFVDEYHLFNRTERATFNALLRNADADKPVILMALDPRQSPRAFFLEAAFGSVEAAAPLAAGHAKQLRDFEFDEVFRYTPEIAQFLRYVNQQFPENDLSEEWLPGLATSVLPSGELPIAREFADQTLLYDAAVASAEKLQKEAGRGKTALITLSRKSFSIISQAGRFDKRIYVVDSRESLNRLQYVGRRIVFSMPEYVAGVQFDHVIISDTNELDDIGRPTTLARIRFGSSLYLAASRARTTVSIYGNSRFGGLAPVIQRAIQQKIVVRQ